MKKIISLVLVLVLALTAIGGTLAYFTDTDEAENVFTVGNVDIELHEKGNIDGTEKQDEEYRDALEKTEVMPGVEFDKEVWVENTGSQPAYIIVTIEIDDDLAPTWRAGWEADWDWSQEDTGDSLIHTFKLKDPLAAKTKTAMLLTDLTLNGNIDSLTSDGSYNVPINVYAIQSAGFNTAAEAYTALETEIALEKTVIASTPNDLNEALAAGKVAQLSENLNSANAINVVPNSVLDGAGNTLNRVGGTAPNGGVVTTGGTVKSITITGEKTADGKSFRAVYANAGLAGDLVIENANLTGGYAINITGNNGDYGMTVKNSTLNGWVSYDKLSHAIFDNVDFITTTDEAAGGKAVNVLKPYSDTTLNDCDFTDPYTLGNGDGVAYLTITMNNVTVGNVKVDATNLTTKFSFDESFHGTVIVDGVSVLVD